MFIYILYFLIALATTTLGAITGIGGGVIIKPVLDILGHYNSASISVISSATVFSMALMSIIKQLLGGSKIQTSIVIPLALGSIFGGFLGQKMLNLTMLKLENANFIVIIQNSLLAILIMFTFIYTIKQNSINTKNVKGFMPSILVGIILGIISSFLSIGGGPINIIVFMYFFSFDIKKSTVSSIVTILFSQLSNLLSIALATSFKTQDTTVVPIMIIAAIAGGFLGSKLSLSFNEKQINTAFKIVQILVFAICLTNIINSLSYVLFFN